MRKVSVIDKKQLRYILASWVFLGYNLRMFKFVKITHRYMVKTMPQLLWVAAIPAVIIGLFSHPSSPLLFLYSYKDTKIGGLPHGFYGLFDKIFDFAVPWWQLFIVIVLVPVFASLIVGLMERHLRSGRFGFKQPLSRINESFMGILPVLLITTVFYAVMMLFTVGAVTLGHYFFSGFGNLPGAVSYIWAAVVIIGTQLLAGGVFSMVLLIPPVCITVGYPFKYSAGYAYKLRNKNATGIFAACIYPFAVVFVVGLLFGVATDMFLPSNLAIIGNIISYLYLFLYFPALSLTAYYELSGTERMDYKRGFGNKGRYQ